LKDVCSLTANLVGDYVSCIPDCSFVGKNASSLSMSLKADTVTGPNDAVTAEGVPKPMQVELRNGVIVISETSKKEKPHLNVTRKEWSEFVVGQRSFADQDKVIAQFESVLVRKAVPAQMKAMDDKLDNMADDIGYLCDGGEDH